LKGSFTKCCGPVNTFSTIFVAAVAGLTIATLAMTAAAVHLVVILVTSPLKHSGCAAGRFSMLAVCPAFANNAQMAASRHLAHEVALANQHRT